MIAQFPAWSEHRKRTSRCSRLDLWRLRPRSRLSRFGAEPSPGAIVVRDPSRQFPPASREGLQGRVLDRVTFEISLEGVLGSSAVNDNDARQEMPDIDLLGESSGLRINLLRNADRAYRVS